MYISYQKAKLASKKTIYYKTKSKAKFSQIQNSVISKV